MGLLGLLKTDAFEKGRIALLKGNGAKAESAFRKAEKEGLEPHWVHMGFMQSFLLQGKSDDLIEYFDALAPKEQEHYEHYVIMALAMQINHFSTEGFLQWLETPADGPERLAYLKDLAEEHKKCSVVIADWAVTALEQYDIEQADDALKKLRDARPPLQKEKISQLYARRDSIMLQKFPHILRALEEAALVNEPKVRLDILLPLASEFMNLAPLQYDTGIACLELGDLPRAVRFLGRATDLNPYWVGAWLRLGEACIQKGLLSRAKDAFACAFALQEEDWLAITFQRLDMDVENSDVLPFIEQGSERVQVRDFWGAQYPLREALKIDSRNMQARFLLGEALYFLREYDESISHLLQAWELVDYGRLPHDKKLPRLLEVCGHRCVVDLVEENCLGEAIDVLSEILRNNAPFEVLHDDYVILQRLQNGEVSKDAFISFARAHPLERARRQDRLDFLERTIVLAPLFPEALLYRGVLRAKQGKLEPAKLDLEMALQKSSQPWKPFFHQAGLAFLMQDNKRAQELWMDCASSQIQPWAGMAQENLRTLNSGQGGQLIIAALPRETRSIDIAPAPGQPMQALGAAQPEQVDPALFQIPSNAPGLDSYTEASARDQFQSQLPNLSEVAPNSQSPDFESPVEFHSQAPVHSAGAEFHGLPQEEPAGQEADLFDDDDPFAEPEMFGGGEVSPSQDAAMSAQASFAPAPNAFAPPAQDVFAPAPLAPEPIAPVQSPSAQELEAQLFDDTPEPQSNAQAASFGDNLFDSMPSAPATPVAPAPPVEPVQASAPASGGLEDQLFGDLSIPQEPPQPVANIAKPAENNSPSFDDLFGDIGGLTTEPLGKSEPPPSQPPMGPASSPSLDAVFSTIDSGDPVGGLDLFGGDDDAMLSFLDEAISGLDDLEKKE